MSLRSLNAEQTIGMLRHVARGVVAGEELLSSADRAIGDGDHGIGMARGFRAVEAKLDGATAGTPQEVFRLVGVTLLATIGGAAGAVFGSFFQGAAAGLGDCPELDGSGLARALTAGLEKVQARGGARTGDKTMIDALEPAARAAAELREQPLDQILAGVESAARGGMENTKAMVAATGKARSLGERSLGFADPGALSMSLIFHLASDYVSLLALGKTPAAGSELRGA